MENKLYKDKYGNWAGNSAGHKPDFTRCCEEVRDNSTRWPHYYQCNRKRGFGPDEAYCKQHDPEAVQKRRDEQDRKYKEQRNKQMYEWYGKRFFNALKLIADGHNDARGLAQETIAEFEKNLR